MKNRLWRAVGNGLALVCLSVFGAIVLAACETPAPGVAAPTVSEEIADISSLAADTSRNVGLSNAFKGEKLTLSARSSNTNVAFATIAADNRSIVIRAIGPGTATITVTATNSGGSVSQSFTVTVTAPTPTPTPTPPPPTPTPPDPEQTEQSDCPERMEITRGGRKSCTLTEDHSLVYTGTLLRVSGPPGGSQTNVWTITALLKGRPVVQIREDKTGNTVDEITVVVPNTPPRLTGTATATLTDVTLTSSDTTGLHTGTITAILGAFEDDDTADTAFNYKVQHKPDELLIKTTKGFLLPTNSASADITAHEFVVLKPFNEDFEIEVYAYDQDNARSDRPVIVTFDASTPVTPAAGSYTAKQRDNGTFEDVRLGNRLDKDHTLTFSAPLKIATDLNTKLTVADSSGRVYLSSAVSTADSNATTGVCASNKIPSSLELGTYCYTYTAGRRITVTPPTLALTAPTITFQLPSKENGLTGGSDSITLQYFVGAYSQAKPSGEHVADSDPETVYRSATARVTLRIHKCTDTADCPINNS